MVKTPEEIRRLKFATGITVKAHASFRDAIRIGNTDEDLFRAASRDGRAVVTENAKDFDRIVRTMAAGGEHHTGVVFTSPRRYHRGSAAYPANLVGALAALLADPPADQSDWVHWLP